MIIANYIEKIKRFQQKAIYFLAEKDTLVSLIVIATGISAFGLGFLAGEDTSKTSSKVIFSESNKAEILAASAIAVATSSKTTQTVNENRVKSTIFGSKSGTKYYYSWCKSGNRVKLENRIYFESDAQALGAGRTLAANCK